MCITCFVSKLQSVRQVVSTSGILYLQTFCHASSQAVTKPAESY